MTVTHVYAAEISKSYRDDAGDLVVEGIATSPDLDLDKQVCDPEWLKSAMPEWFEWGNIRAQHSELPAGHAIDMERLPGDKWWIKTVVTEPTAAHMVETGTYKGFSIGIMAPQVLRDAAAKSLGAHGGRIVGGDIVHVGLVDRPCNPVAVLNLAKAAKPGMTVKATELDRDRMLVKVCEVEEHPENADQTVSVEVTPKDGLLTSEVVLDIVRDATSKGAMPPLKEGGKPRYPISNVQDLKDAILAYGRGRDADKPEIRAHIISEAKRLSRTDMIPDNWTKAAEHDTDEIATIRDGLVACINAELQELCDGEPELCDIEQLLCSLSMLMSWWEHEASEGEIESPYTEDEDDEVAVWLAAQPETEKAMADTGNTTTDTPTADKAAGPKTPDTPAVPERLTELVKVAVAEANRASDERVKALEAELAKVLAQPVPGGPVIARTSDDAQAAVRNEKLANFRHLEKTVTDRDLRTFYSEQVKLLQNGSDT